MSPSTEERRLNSLTFLSFEKPHAFQAVTSVTPIFTLVLAIHKDMFNQWASNIRCPHLRLFRLIFETGTRQFSEACWPTGFHIGSSKLL